MTGAKKLAHEVSGLHLRGGGERCPCRLCSRHCLVLLLQPVRLYVKGVVLGYKR